MDFPCVEVTEWVAGSSPAMTEYEVRRTHKSGVGEATDGRVTFIIQQ
jgi:hypothetical protein